MLAFMKPALLKGHHGGGFHTGFAPVLHERMIIIAWEGNECNVFVAEERKRKVNERVTKCYNML